MIKKRETKKKRKRAVTREIWQAKILELLIKFNKMLEGLN